MTSSAPRPPAEARGESGLVLIEVLVALAIFAAVVLAWARSTDSAIAGAVRANEERTLRMLAARKLAEIRARPTAYEEDDEGGFEEAVDYGEANPFEDYRWGTRTEKVIAAGKSDEEDAVYLFQADEDADPPKTPAGQAAREARKLLRVHLTITYAPPGEEEGGRFSVITYLPPPRKKDE